MEMHVARIDRRLRVDAGAEQHGTGQGACEECAAMHGGVSPWCGGCAHSRRNMPHTMVCLAGMLKRFCMTLWKIRNAACEATRALGATNPHNTVGMVCYNALLSGTLM
jgi:hypothetical protein